MASGGNIIQQRKLEIERSMKTLVNQDLKEICKSYGYQVSGNKAALLMRVSEILANHVHGGDLAKLEKLQYRVNHHGQSPPQHSGQSSANSYSNQAYSHYNMAPQRSGGGMHRAGSGRTYFKSSPFYEILETLVPFQDLPEMPQNRHSVKVNLTLNGDTAQRFRTENLRILMYCGQSNHMGAYATTDVAFPNQIEVLVNNAAVKANFKGLKNKPGSTKPADITGFVRKFGGQQNDIHITYALTTKRFTFAIFLAKYIAADKLIEKIQRHNIIRKQKVLDAMARANADPDIAATSIRMSIKDPISTMRITLPIRSSHCTHNQCFDAAMFMQLQEQAPQWSCPICAKHIPLDSLCVDEYFQDILNNTSKATEKVDVEPDGQWKVIKEEEDSDTNGASSSKPRASYDDDFDDDIVELDEPSDGKKANGVKKDSQNQQSPGVARSGIALDTPPLSSREASVAQSATSAQRPTSNKRPQSSVIDLTLSDEDEDELPRPAKRQHTLIHSGNRNNSSNINTPTSIPDQRFQPPQQRQSFGNYSEYRPNSASYQDHQQPPNSFGSGFNTYKPQESLSPPVMNSPMGFGQTGWGSAHTRTLPSNYHTPNGGAYTPNGSFAPQSPFAMRPPSSHEYGGGGGGGGGGHTQSPAQQSSGLRLPPIPQNQQLSSSFSPPPAFPSNWRGDNHNSNGVVGGGNNNSGGNTSGGDNFSF